MDLQTLQALAVIVNTIGLVGTVGLISLILAWNLAPVLAEFLRAKIAALHAQASADNARADVIRKNGSGEIK